MKHLIGAVVIAVIAVIATEVRANDVVDSPLIFGGTSAFTAYHTDSNDFTDIFTFGISGPVIADGFLATINLAPGNNINFTSANLNGTGYFFPFSPGFAEIGLLLPTSFTGPLILTVSGTTNAGGGVNSSYSGTLNINAASVPEPASLMLLGAGLAGIGIWRRKLMKI